MIRTVIDPQVFSLQRRGGISRYFVELLRHDVLFRRHGVAMLTPYRRVVNEHAVEDLPARFHPLPAHGARLNRALLSLRAAQHAWTSRSDVVHHTYYDRRFLGSPGRRARVCTVYDMIPERFPEHFPGGNPHLAKREFLTRSDRVIAISQTTKDDVVELYGIEPERITVIPLGVGARFTPGDAGDVAAQRRPHLLFVGARSGYKNFDVLVRAMACEPLRSQDLSLVVVGSPFSAAEQEQLRAAGLQGRVVRRSATEAELADCYRQAAAFVFPSRYEGFGLPVLEAMASGCPAVLARGGSLPEVGGGAAVYFDPDQPEDLGAAVLRVLAGDGRADRVRAGLARAAGFSWEQTASRTARLYAGL